MGLVSVRSVCLAAALTVTAAGFAAADDDEGRHEGAARASRAAANGEFVPLAKIVAAIRERYPGRIVETEFESAAGRPYYEFHILAQDGRLIEIKVDARDGRYIAGQTDDD